MGGCSANWYGGAAYVRWDADTLSLSGRSRLLSNSAGLSGGAIAIMGAAAGIVLNPGSRVQGNEAVVSGGGVHISGNLAGLRLDASTIVDNHCSDGSTALGYGGFLYVGGELGQATINNSTIQGNHAGVWGGAVCVIGSAESFTVSSGTQVLNNTVGQIGGAIAILGGANSFTLSGGSSLVGNLALNVSKSYAGALLVNGPLENLYILEGSRVIENSAAMGGGAIVVDGDLGQLLVDGSEIAGNHCWGPAPAIECSGGFLLVSFHLGKAVFTGGSKVHGNRAGYNGGVLDVGGTNASSIFVLGKSRLWDNWAGSSGGCFAVSYLKEFLVADSELAFNSALSGGVLDSEGGVENITLTANAKVESNVATSTGGFFSVITNTLENPEAVLVGSLVIRQGSSLSHNVALGSRGGAVWTGGTVGSLIIMEGSRVHNNSAPADGGAVMVVWGSLHRLVVDASEVSDNHVQQGFGGFLAVESDLGTAMFANSSYIYNNSAGAEGGVVFVSGATTSISIIDGSVFEGNQAGSLGGCISARDLGSVFISSSKLLENVAERGGVLFADKGSPNITLTLGANITRNQASRMGGAFYLNDGLGLFLVDGGSSVSHNDAAGERASYQEGESFAGGVLYVQGSAEYLRIVGGSYVQNNSALVHGGAFYITGLVSQFTVANSSVVARNAARLGSGGVLRSVGGIGSIAISNASRVAENTAGENGGVIGCLNTVGLDTDEVVLTNVVISRNTAFGHGGVFSFVGGVREVHICASQLTRNAAAAGHGGCIGVFGSLGSVLLEAGTVVSGNTAGASGGFVSVLSPTIGVMVSPGGRADPGVLLGSLEVRNGTQLVSNTAQLLGGAVAAPLIAGFMLSGGSMLNNNTAVSGAGGAIAEASAVVSDMKCTCTCSCMLSVLLRAIHALTGLHGYIPTHVTSTLLHLQSWHAPICLSMHMWATTHAVFCDHRIRQFNNTCILC